MQTILAVRFYCSSTGTEPVRDWLKSKISTSARKEIGADIKTVQFGWPIGMPVVRKMESGLWEVRSKIPEGIARVLFTVIGSEMILLHGFIKKSSSTPKEDLELARKRMKEVKNE
jgi:phage-related protein